MLARTRPGAPFWATVATFALLAYPLSFGPAFWITSQANLTWIGADVVPVVYSPMMSAWDHGPEPVQTVLAWYLAIGTKKNWVWHKLSYEYDDGTVWKKCEFGPTGFPEDEL